MEIIDDILSIVDEWVKYHVFFRRIPQASIGIIKNNEIILKKNYDSLNNEKIKIDAKYRIGSISKIFTIISILQMVEKDKIKIDDNVSKYLKWFNVKRKITIRNLITHSSGMVRDGDTAHWFGEEFPSKEHIEKNISEKLFVNSPFKEFKYSNWGYGILGMIIEEVSGVPYGVYVRENILNRIGMENTYSDFNESIDKSIIKGYSRYIPGKKRKIFENKKARGLAPACGFCSNVEDLMKLNNALISEDEKLISKKSHNILNTKFKKNKIEWNMGLLNIKIGEEEITGHSGAFMGFSTALGYSKKKGIGITVLTNSTDGSAMNLLGGIYHIITRLEEEYPKYPKVKNPKKYSGKFESEWADLNVSNIGKSLVMYIPSGTRIIEGVMKLKQLGENKFRIVSGSNTDYLNEEVEFVFDNTGNIEILKVGPNPWKKRR